MTRVFISPKGCPIEYERLLAGFTEPTTNTLYTDNPAQFANREGVVFLSTCGGCTMECNVRTCGLGGK